MNRAEDQAVVGCVACQRRRLNILDQRSLLSRAARQLYSGRGSVEKVARAKALVDEGRRHMVDHLLEVHGV